MLISSSTISIFCFMNFFCQRPLGNTLTWQFHGEHGPARLVSAHPYESVMVGDNARSYGKPETGPLFLGRIIWFEDPDPVFGGNAVSGVGTLQPGDLEGRVV